MALCNADWGNAITARLPSDTVRGIFFSSPPASMFCSLGHFCACCVCGRRARQLQVWRNTGANCFLPLLNSLFYFLFFFLSWYALCDTRDGTGGGGKHLCEPGGHVPLSRLHVSLLIYSPLRLVFLPFFSPLNLVTTLWRERLFP